MIVHATNIVSRRRRAGVKRVMLELIVALARGLSAELWSMDIPDASRQDGGAHVKE